MKIITALAALAIAASFAQAQAEPDPLKTKALSFGFNGSSQVGGKIWISNQDAVTLRVGGTTSSTTREATDTSDVDDEYGNSNVSVGVGLERHIDLGLGFSPYLTGGVSIGHDRYTNSSGTTSNPYETKSTAINLGVNAGVGIEYWLTRRISLAGQQLISGSYGFGKYTSGLAGSPTQDSRTFSLGLGTSSLILSMYL